MKVLGYVCAMLVLATALTQAGYAAPGPMARHGGPVGGKVVAPNKGPVRQGMAPRNGGLPATPGKGSSSINGTGMRGSSSNINGTDMKIRH